MKRILSIAAATMTGLAVSIGAPALAHAAPATPFTQCPVVGDAKSCQILLTVNKDSSISVAKDPSASYYSPDWTQGSMIGIVNSSSRTIYSILLKGTWIADFDGAAMCQLIDCTWPTANGFEGPNTVLTPAGDLMNEVKVDFPAGLKPGASTFFSLLNAPDSATILSASAPASQTKTYNYLVQVDRYNPIVKGNAKATAYLKKLVASLDDDGVLKHREDVGICGPSATCLRARTQAQFVKVSIAGNSAPSKAQIIAAVNKATTKAIGDVTTTQKLSKVTGPVTVAWILDTAHGASPTRPWGPKYNLQQTFLGRS